MNKNIEQLEKKMEQARKKQEQKKNEAIEIIEKLDEVYYQKAAEWEMEKNKWTSKKRKMETHAKIVFGGMLISLDPNKNWTQLNPTRLYDFLQANKDVIRNYIFDNEKLEADEANKRIRQFEKNERKKKKD